jgi:hypothetical protein
VLQYQALRVNAQAIDVMFVSAAVLAGWGAWSSLDGWGRR